MTDKTTGSNKDFSADWLLRGALTRIGDTLDRLTGRRWTPSSSLATSELIERMKKMIDSEAKEIAGKGTVAPHNIKLKIQWDKFSTDSEKALEGLENELLIAAADHINDSLYYTYAPLRLKVKPDYFIEGVKLFVSFEKFSDDEHVAEMNVTMAAINVKALIPKSSKTSRADGIEVFICRYELSGEATEQRLAFRPGGRLSVGRTGSNDLVIDDVSVSKIHASLVAHPEGGLSVADTGSTNGTFINGERISYGKATRLVKGDVVKFGAVDVIFEHLPSFVEVEPQIVASDDTTAIDGLEFKSRTTNEPPAKPTVNAHTAADTLEIQPAANAESAFKTNVGTPQSVEETKAEDTK